MTIERHEQDGYEEGLSTESAIDKAEKEGLKVVWPATNELFIDLDGKEARDTFHKQRPVFEKFFAISKLVETPSRSGRKDRWHIVVTLKHEFTALERLLFQAVLGSDLKREFLGFVRLNVLGEEKPTLFLEKKDA